MRSSKGVTLIELLAATVIMGLLITTVLAPMTTLFQRTTINTQTLQATTQVQETLEVIRGQWRTFPTPSSPYQATCPTDVPSCTLRNLNDTSRDSNRNAYDLNCYTLPTAPSGVTVNVTINALNRNGVVGATQSRNCGGSAPAVSAIPVMKRVTVTAVANNTQAILSIDIPRPPANDPQQITN